MSLQFSDPAFQILHILKEVQSLHLHDLAQRINQSTEATQEALNTLIQAGIPIEYQAQSTWIKRAWEPLQAIIAPDIIDGMTVLDVVDSTNQYLKQPQFHQQRQVCVAEMQTAGKGRFGRKWISPFGLNLYLSLRYHFNQALSKLSGLSIIIGLAVCRALNNKAIQVKWPNDLWFNQKKLGGILIEIVETSEHTTEVIIGLGLNINGSPKHHGESYYPWTSIAEIKGKQQDRQRIMQAILEEIHHALNHFSQAGLTAFMQDWQQRDALWGKELEITQGQKKFLGQSQGINYLGQLILKDSEQVLHKFDGGEVTIKL